MNALAGYSLLFLLGAVIILFLIGRMVSNKIKGWLSFIAGLGSLGAILWLSPTVIGGETIEFNLFPWQAESPFALYFDGLSLVFSLMAAGIGSAILVYCIDYMQHEKGTTRFYMLMLTFIAGLIGLVSARSLIMVYLCWEIIGLCSYFLVGFWYNETAAVNGARKVLVMTHIPGYALLLAILLLYRDAGTFTWTDPAIAANFNTGIFLLILIAAMAKSVMFPVHTWIPEAMNAPTPVSALLHSACYVKAGVYLVARMYSIAPWQPSWNVILLVIGCITMIVGTLFALAQTDLKRLLAFSTISQLGYIMTAFGIGTPFGALAGVFYVFSHGLFKGTLFLCAGAIQHAAGTRDMRQLGGLAKTMPRTAVIWLIAAAAIIGVPLTNGFVAKWLLYDSALASGNWAVVIIAWLVSTFTAFYILKATVSVFYGEPSDFLTGKKVEEASSVMLTGMGILAALSLIIGIAPQLLVDWLAKPAMLAMKFDSTQTISFLGFHLDQSGVPVTAGAVLAISALLIVWIIYAIRKPSPHGVSSFTGGDPLPERNSLNTVDFSEFVEDIFSPALKVLDPDPVYTGIWRGVFTFSQWIKQVSEKIESSPIVLIVGAAVLLSVVIWLV
ncbi:NADH-quinone oxidoreductase subunit L [Leptolinea sp. HRD-7]|nr:NADH-quinone oxidoreductase subunit L [Leptolinea sp. HRD-7]